MSSDYDKKYYRTIDGVRYVTVEHANSLMNRPSPDAGGVVELCVCGKPKGKHQYFQDKLWCGHTKDDGEFRAISLPEQSADVVEKVARAIHKASLHSFTNDHIVNASWNNQKEYWMELGKVAITSIQGGKV